MKELVEGKIYYVKEGETIRFWHNCKKYKDRDEARVELVDIGEDPEEWHYKCPLCDFEYKTGKLEL